jgi:hypothetical protein
MCFLGLSVNFTVFCHKNLKTFKKAAFPYKLADATFNEGDHFSALENKIIFFFES